jgi:hypothetical protein
MFSQKESWMNLNNSIDEYEPCVLVERPTSADADFYGKWLRAGESREARDDP